MEKIKRLEKMERLKKISEIGFPELELITVKIVQSFNNSEEILMPYYIITSELEKSNPNFIELINTIDDLLNNLILIGINEKELLVFESLKMYIGKNAFGGDYVKKEVHQVIYLSHVE